MANPEGRRQEGARATQVHCEIDGRAVPLAPDQLRPSGAFVPSNVAPPLDAEIELTLRSPVGDAVLRALVVQVITREQAAQSGRVAGFGVLFLDLVDDQRAFIGLTLDALDRAARAEAAAAAAQRRHGPTRPRPRPRIPSSPLEPPVAATRKRKLSTEGTATLQRLRSELEKLPTRSPSAVLGLEPTADAETVRNAFLEISKRCHPHVYARFDSAEINTAATDLFIAYKRAYASVRATARSVPKAAAGTAVSTASLSPVEAAAAPAAAAATTAAVALDPVIGFELAAPVPQRGPSAGSSSSTEAVPARRSSPPPPPPASARALAQHLGQSFGGRVAISSAQRSPAREPVAARGSLNPQPVGPVAVISERPRASERRAVDTEMALRAALKHLAGARFDQAELELERLCELCPEHRDSQVWLHVCRARKQKAAQRPDAALEHYRAVLALDPEHREASEHVGRGRKRSAVGKWFTGDDE